MIIILWIFVHLDVLVLLPNLVALMYIYCALLRSLPLVQTIAISCLWRATTVGHSHDVDHLAQSYRCITLAYQVIRPHERDM